MLLPPPGPLQSALVAQNPNAAQQAPVAGLILSAGQQVAKPAVSPTQVVPAPQHEKSPQVAMPVGLQQVMI